MGSIAGAILGGDEPEKKKEIVPEGSGERGEQMAGKIGSLQPVGSGQKIESLGDIYNTLYRQKKNLTEQEEAEASKKAKASALIMGLGDGISALTNLYYTTKGAPSVKQSSSLGRFQADYERAKARREKLRDQLFVRLEDAGRDQVLYDRRRREIQDQRNREDTLRGLAWQREDSKRTEDKEEREGVRLHTWEREDARDVESKRRFDAQFGLSVKQADRAQQNAETGLGLQKERYELQGKKEREVRVNQFKKMQGDEIPFTINGKTYVVGSKALSANVGNIVANILEDIRNSDQFKDKSDKELSKDQEWYAINRALNTSKSDVKKLAESMKRYAKYSPSAVAAFQHLSDYYTKGKREAENGSDDLSLGLDWGNENDDDSLGLGWDR